MAGPTDKKSFNPPSVRTPFGQYNHGLYVPPGASLLVTSGQLGIRPDDTIPPDLTGQAEVCFDAIAVRSSTTSTMRSLRLRPLTRLDSRAQEDGFTSGR